MNGELDLNLDPEKGLLITEELTAQVGPSVAAINPQGLTDKAGNVFDSAIHKTNADGSPMLGSKNQFLLKKEAKKTAAQWVKEKVSDIFHGEKTETAENPEVRKVPLSDHELPPEIEEIPPNPKNENESIPVGNVSASAQVSAEVVFMGYSMLLGSTVYEHRGEFYPRVCRIMHDEELRTGKTMPIPEWAIMPLALFQVGAEICQKDQRCKKAAVDKFTAVKKTVIKSQMKKTVFSWFKKSEGGADDQV